MALAPARSGLGATATGVTGVLVPVEQANPGAGANVGWTTYDHTPSGDPLYVVDAPSSYPRVPVPANARGISTNDLRQYYGVNPDGSFASGSAGGIVVYNNDPTSAAFYPDPSIEGYSVAYWVMQGAPVATAQTYAAKWAAALGRAVVKISDLGPIGPGDPLYQKLQSQNALNLAVLATQPAPPVGNVLDTSHTTAPGATLPVNAPPTGPSETVAPPPPTDGSQTVPAPTIASVAQSTTTTPQTAGVGGILALLVGGGLLFALTKKGKR